MSKVYGFSEVWVPVKCLADGTVVVTGGTGGGGGSGITQAEVQEAVEAAIALPTVAFQGTIEVSGSSTNLPSNVLRRGVWVQLPFDEVQSVFVGGSVGEGQQLLPGERIFLEIANTNLVFLVSPVTGKDSITVYWWAS